MLLQYQGQHDINKSAAVAKLLQQKDIYKLTSELESKFMPKLDSDPLQEVLNTNKVTKEVSDILMKLESGNQPQFILIEGAPGIGKTFLLKEIAYLWGSKKVLQKFSLVLLVCLRDPDVQKCRSLNDLLKLLCIRWDVDADKIAKACNDYLSNAKGKDVIFLLDGYDEYPQALQKCSFIADILCRRELFWCSLIVSSRPHASLRLREIATVRVEILGFTKAEQIDYIKATMVDHESEKFQKLTAYLNDHSTLRSLCFIPFNIGVLVYLCSMGISLPKSFPELYRYFICLTVCRHLIEKDGTKTDSSITELKDLPEPCKSIIQQLSKFSLKALNENRLVFDFNEIQEVCPGITSNGYGLLQTVEYHGFTGTKATCNFIHFSIQEYLAAHYISNLPSDIELRIIEEKFWSANHFNMFSFYIALTKGLRPSFRKYISKGNKDIAISKDFLGNQLACFRLYHCFYEAGEVETCKILKESTKFINKEISLQSVKLIPSDIECIALFLTSSFPMKWEKLDFLNCQIEDYGLYLLHHGLCHSNDVFINELLLGYNGLTTLSSPFISEIVLKCKVNNLSISGNKTIGENEQLYSILTSSSSMLEYLYMSDTKLSSRGASTLFKYVENSKLKKINIAYNDITDDACEIIAELLAKNSHLATLHMFKNTMITGKAILKMVNTLKDNNTLKELLLPGCADSIKEQLHSLEEGINKKRECQHCNIKLKIIPFL